MSINDFLDENDMKGYINVFKKNNIKFAEDLIGLNETELLSIGIDKLGDRKRLLKLIDEISPRKKKGKS